MGIPLGALNTDIAGRAACILGYLLATINAETAILADIYFAEATLTFSAEVGIPLIACHADITAYTAAVERMLKAALFTQTTIGADIQSCSFGTYKTFRADPAFGSAAVNAVIAALRAGLGFAFITLITNRAMQAFGLRAILAVAAVLADRITITAIVAVTAVIHVVHCALVTHMAVFAECTLIFIEAAIAVITNPISRTCCTVAAQIAVFRAGIVLRQAGTAFRTVRSEFLCTIQADVAFLTKIIGILFEAVLTKTTVQRTTVATSAIRTEIIIAGCKAATAFYTVRVLLAESVIVYIALRAYIAFLVPLTTAVALYTVFDPFRIGCLRECRKYHYEAQNKT